MTTREIGYVVGCDKSREGHVVWKVRVNDPTSAHDGEKLVVASVCDRLELARGLNVNFVIGTVDNDSGGKSPRAVDVCPELAEAQMHIGSRSGGQS